MDASNSPIGKKHSNYDMTKGEQYFLKNMLSTNRSGTQFLNEDNTLLKREMSKQFEGEENSAQQQSRSGQLYRKQASSALPGDAIGEDTPTNIPAINNRAGFSRLRTIETSGPLEGEESARIVEIPKNAMQLNIPNSKDSPRRNSTISAHSNMNDKRNNITLGALPPVSQIPTKDHPRTSINNFGASGSQKIMQGSSYEYQRNEVQNVYGEQSHKVSEILREWQERLQKVEKRIEHDTGARDYLVKDIRLLEEELRESNLRLKEKEDRLKEVCGILDEAKSTADKISKSMDGLAMAIERETKKRFNNLE